MTVQVKLDRDGDVWVSDDGKRWIWLSGPDVAELIKRWGPASMHTSESLEHDHGPVTVCLRVLPGDGSGATGTSGAGPGGLPHRSHGPATCTEHGLPVQALEEGHDHQHA